MSLLEGTVDAAAASEGTQVTVDAVGSSWTSILPEAHPAASGQGHLKIPGPAVGCRAILSALEAGGGNPGPAWTTKTVSGKLGENRDSCVEETLTACTPD